MPLFHTNALTAVNILRPSIIPCEIEGSSLIRELLPAPNPKPLVAEMCANEDGGHLDDLICFYGG